MWVLWDYLFFLFYYFSKPLIGDKQSIAIVNIWVHQEKEEMLISSRLQRQCLFPYTKTFTNSSIINTIKGNFNEKVTVFSSYEKPMLTFWKSSFCCWLCVWNYMWKHLSCDE